MNVQIVNWVDCGDVIERLGYTPNEPHGTLTDITVESEEELFEIVKKFLAQTKKDGKVERQINVMIAHCKDGYMLGIDDRLFMGR
jgi:hypothetical protein